GRGEPERRRADAHLRHQHCRMGKSRPRPRRVFWRDSSGHKHGRSEQTDFARNAGGNRGGRGGGMNEAKEVKEAEEVKEKLPPPWRAARRPRKTYRKLCTI